MIDYADPQAVAETAVDWVLAGWEPEGLTWHGTIGENTSPPEAPASDSQDQTDPAAWLRYSIQMPADLQGYLDPSAAPTGQGALAIEISVQPGAGTEPFRVVWRQLLERFGEYTGSSVRFLPDVPQIFSIPSDGWASRIYSVPFWIVGGPEDLSSQ